MNVEVTPELRTAGDRYLSAVRELAVSNAMLEEARAAERQASQVQNKWYREAGNARTALARLVTGPGTKDNEEIAEGLESALAALLADSFERVTT